MNYFHKNFLEILLEMHTRLCGLFRGGFCVNAYFRILKISNYAYFRILKNSNYAYFWMVQNANCAYFPEPKNLKLYFLKPIDISSELVYNISDEVMI